MAKKPEDAIAAWKDTDGVAYCLRSQDPTLEENEIGIASKPFHHEYWSEVSIEIGKDILVKVKYFPPGWTDTEGDAMDLVRRCTPEVPIPECIHHWIDQKWNRSFLIRRRVPGVELGEVWWRLSYKEKQSLCRELAEYQDSVARNITSNGYQNASGKARKNGFYSANDVCKRRWDPDTRDVPVLPLTADQLREQMSKYSGGIPIPDLSPVFHFSHEDLGPTNVIVSIGDQPEDGGERKVNVAAIIDWASAVYVPSWWITLGPLVNNHMYVVGLPPPDIDANPVVSKRFDYVDRLDYFMELHGWEPGRTHVAWFMEYIGLVRKDNLRELKEAKLAGRIPWLPSME